MLIARWVHRPQVSSSALAASSACPCREQGPRARAFKQHNLSAAHQLYTIHHPGALLRMLDRSPAQVADSKNGKHSAPMKMTRK